jgi:hypothetical protein
MLIEFPLGPQLELYHDHGILQFGNTLPTLVGKGSQFVLYAKSLNEIPTFDATPQTTYL